MQRHVCRPPQCCPCGWDKRQPADNESGLQPSAPARFQKRGDENHRGINLSSQQLILGLNSKLKVNLKTVVNLKKKIFSYQGTHDLPQPIFGICPKSLRKNATSQPTTSIFSVCPTPQKSPAAMQSSTHYMPIFCFNISINMQHLILPQPSSPSVPNLKKKSPTAIKSSTHYRPIFCFTVQQKNS